MKRETVYAILAVANAFAALMILATSVVVSAPNSGLVMTGPGIIGLTLFFVLAVVNFLVLINEAD